MKLGWIVGLVTLSLGTASAAPSGMASDEASRLKASANVLQAIRGADNGIPEGIWNKAACVVVVPSVKKAAFIFGGEYGRGVASCRSGAKWTAPAFVQLEKGSWGFQAGAEEIDLVLLVMNRAGMQKLLQDQVSLGAGVSVAAGPVGRTATADTDAQLHAGILSYSRSQGAFAGVNLSGGVLGPDSDANHQAYGANTSTSDVLLGPTSVPAPPEAASLMTALGAGTTR